MVDYFEHTSLVEGADLKAYFMAHVEAHSKPSFYQVVTPLKVFKAIYTKGNISVCALLIPEGALVYASPSVFRTKTYLKSYNSSNDRDDRKMRASRAIVNSIHSPRKGFERASGYAGHDHTFKYRPGMTVVPKKPFSMARMQCASGIHIFLNFNDAYNYLY